MINSRSKSLDLRMLRDGQSFISGGREFHNLKVDGRK